MPEEETPEEQNQLAQHDYFLGRWQMIADFHMNLDPVRYDPTHRAEDDPIKVRVNVRYNNEDSDTTGLVTVGSTAQEQNPSPGTGWIIEAIAEGGVPAADFRTVRDQYVLDVNTGEFWTNAMGPWTRRGTVSISTFVTYDEFIPQPLTYMLPV